MKLMKSNGAIVFALILLLSNLGLADAIAEDSKVTTEFTLKLQDGTVVAQCRRMALMRKRPEAA
mgnify:CR=1 FL=1